MAQATANKLGATSRAAIMKLNRFAQLFFVIAHVIRCDGMFSKRALPNAGEGATAPKRFRSNMVDLFLNNDVSGARAQSLFSDAAACRLNEFKDLAKAGGPRNKKGNMQRDLLNKLCKGSKWPDLYQAPVRVFNNRTQTIEVVQLPMLLAHELVFAMNKRSTTATLGQTTGMCQTTAEHMRKISAEMQCPDLIGLALWGDGVPCNWDKSQSLEVFAVSFPGLHGDQKTLRIPLTCINKDHCTPGTETIDDILAIVSWSFQCLASGAMPACRHDGTAFGRSDSKRAKWAGKAVAKTVLCEVRGDWAFYKKAFRFPQHNEVQGCCWRCRVTPASFRDVGASAPWRTDRLSHWDFLVRLAQNSLTPSPLFSCPYITTDCFLLDWLHCMDLGVSADWLGSLFKLVASRLPGNNSLERTRALFLQMQQYWADFEIESKLVNLTAKMLQQPKKSPKMRGGAAVIRHLIPFALQVANKYLNPANDYEKTVQQATFHLACMYEQLSADIFDKAVLKDHSRKFAVLAVACEAAATEPRMFAVKPKLHLMQELCETTATCPSLHWCYRDEDFGGGTMQTGKRRGGRNKVQGTAATVLKKFMTKNPVPWL